MNPIQKNLHHKVEREQTASEAVSDCLVFVTQRIRPWAPDAQHAEQLSAVQMTV